MKLLVSWSGGKDSQASLIYAVKESGFPLENIEAVFCDTGWEHEYTYKHVTEVCKQMGVKLVTLKNPKYDGMVDMAKKRSRFPSSKRRFCTETLKVHPMIDYVLSHKEHLLIYQGIRSDESANRSKMDPSCTYFKFYFQPYKIDKKGKPKFHTYRKKDVIKFCKEYSDDVFRPVFDWTGEQVMSYILLAGQQPNPLYYEGMKRVGCFPCIMCTQSEIANIVKNHPKYIERLESAEAELESTFFAPGFIPKRYARTKGYNTIQDVVEYINDKNATGDMFDETEDELSNHRCMSYYNICE